MKLSIEYHDGTIEIVPTRPQADVVSEFMIFRPGVMLLAEPKVCWLGSDFFSAAMNEGNLRSGEEAAFDDEEQGFCWQVLGSELEDCIEMMAKWIERLGPRFDPEASAEDYLYEEVLSILPEAESKSYANDRKCWRFYMASPRLEAALHLRAMGHQPRW